MSGYTYDPTRSYDPAHPQGTTATPAPVGQPGQPMYGQPNQPQVAQPNQPITGTHTVPDSIDNYKSKSRVGWYIAIALIVVAAIIGGIILNNIPAPQDQPTTTTGHYPTPTDTRTGGIAFDNGAVTGYWLITKTTWSGDSVTVALEIQVDTGTLFYDFYAYGLDDRSQLSPLYEGPQALEPGFAGPGQTVTGTVTFRVPRQSLTLVLSGTGVNQLSALTIEG